MARMIRAAFAVLAVTLAIAPGGCSSTNIDSDLGVVEPGCRAASACFKLGADCPCARGDVSSATCRVCDPTTSTCFCGVGTACIEPDQVCTGRATSLCPGTGARCLPVGHSCASGGGDPPQLVGTGPNGTLQPRCQYTDDVCCPGTLDMSVPDLST
jgi:hypothetical protein